MRAAGVAALLPTGLGRALAGHPPFLCAIADQAVLSLFNMGVAVWLLHALEPASFGVFTILMAVAHGSVAVQDALTSTPLGIRLPTLTGLARRRWLLTVLGNVTYAFAAVAGALVALATALLDGSPALGAGAGLFVGAFVLRSYLRSVAYAAGRPGFALGLDAPVLLLSFAALGALQAAGALTLAAALPALAAANLLALAAALRAPEAGAEAGLPRPAAVLHRYRPFVAEVRWSLLGVLSVLTQRQSHTAVVPALMSPAAYATLAAADTLLGPVRLAAVAIGMVLRPDLARRAACRDWAGVRTVMTRTLLALAAVLALTLAVALAGWPLIERFLFAGKYPEIALPFALAFAITAVQTCRAVPNVTLQVLHDFRTLGRLTLLSAAVSLAGTLAATLALGWHWALLGVLAGEALNSLLTELALRRALALRQGAPTAAVPEQGAAACATP